MKKKVLFCLFAIILAAPVAALAGPFMVSDPNPTAVGGYSDITGAAWMPNPVNLQPDGSIKVDVAAAPTGMTSIQVRVCVNDPVWGVQCSPTVPFSFSRPASPSAPGHTGLVKQ